MKSDPHLILCAGIYVVNMVNKYGIGGVESSRSFLFHSPAHGTRRSFESQIFQRVTDIREPPKRLDGAKIRFPTRLRRRLV